MIIAFFNNVSRQKYNGFFVLPEFVYLSPNNVPHVSCKLAISSGHDSCQLAVSTSHASCEQINATDK